MRALMIIVLMITFMSSIAQAEKRIVVNLASRTLGLYDGNKRLNVYPLGVGKVSTPTPVGYYKILNKEIDPPWIDPSNPEYEVPSGAGNPLGYRWMQIYGNYGIHGTNNPSSIGFYVSNGCIRMREADVEELFDNVEVGTPVDITYNRVVVEKAEDNNIAYYIYPDGYGRQALDVKYVNSWIEPWGVSAFADESEIAEAIANSSGEPIYIGKAYSLKIDDNDVPATTQNGRHFDNKVVERGGITYLPAVPIAIALEMKLEWRHHTTLATRYGEVSGIEKKGQLYLNEDDANILFRVEGWKEGSIYKLKSLGPEISTFGEDKIKTEETDNKDKEQSNNNLSNEPNSLDKNESNNIEDVNTEDKSKVKDKDTNASSKDKPQSNKTKNKSKAKKSNGEVNQETDKLTPVNSIPKI